MCRARAGGAKTEPCLERLPRSFDAVELRLRLLARALDTVHGLHQILHGGIQVCHVEPDWRRKERGVDDEFNDPAPKRIAPHRAQHAIILPRKPIHFLQRLLVHT